MLLRFCLIFPELGTAFEFVGNGECASKCHVTDGRCGINQYYSYSSNIDECQLACENEVACTGFAISKYKGECTIYGNISSVNVDRWANPDAWIFYSPRSTYGYEDFKVNSSTGYEGTRCFRRLDEESNNDSKCLKYSLNLGQ